MVEVFKMLFNARNIRMLVIMAVIISGFIWMNGQMDAKFAAMDAKFEAKFAAMDAKFEAKFNELKYNDFAHLTNAFKALTFVLRENNTITAEQQAYIDSTL
jgi:hypothetical protein